MVNIQPLLAPMPPAIAGEPLSREHALVLQAYHRFRAPLLIAAFVPTAQNVNRAVEWWNAVVVRGEEAP